MKFLGKISGVGFRLTLPLRQRPVNHPADTTAFPKGTPPFPIPTRGISFLTREISFPTGGNPFPTREISFPTGGNPFPTREIPFPTRGNSYCTRGIPFLTRENPFPTRGIPFLTRGISFSTGGISLILSHLRLKHRFYPSNPTLKPKLNHETRLLGFRSPMGRHKPTLGQSLLPARAGRSRLCATFHAS